MYIKDENSPHKLPDGDSSRMGKKSSLKMGTGSKNRDGVQRIAIGTNELFPVNRLKRPQNKNQEMKFKVRKMLKFANGVLDPHSDSLKEAVKLGEKEQQRKPVVKVGSSGEEDGLLLESPVETPKNITRVNPKKLVPTMTQPAVMI